MLKNKKIIRDVLLSICFILLLVVMIYNGVESTLLKETYAITQSDCEAVGGKWYSSFNGCCPNNGVNYTAKGYDYYNRDGNLYCFINTSDWWDDVVGERRIRKSTVDGVDRYLCSVRKKFSNSGNVVTGIQDVSFNYNINCLNEFSDVVWFGREGWNWYQVTECIGTDASIPNTCHDSKRTIDLQKKFIAYYDCLERNNVGIPNGYKETGQCGRMTNLKWDLNCDYYGPLTTCGGAIEGAGCYKKTELGRSQYTWMLHANNNGGTLEKNITTKADCDAKNKVTVKVHYDGTTKSETKSCSIDNKGSCMIKNITQPSGSYFSEFKGWYVSSQNKPSSDCTKEKLFMSGNKNNVTKEFGVTTDNDGKHVFACYSKKYNAILNADGGTFNGKSSTTVSCSTYVNTCNIENLPTPTRNGYTFTGWQGYSSCTSGSTTLLTSSPSNHNKTYYACWVKNEVPTKEYKATFNGNGGTINGKSSDSCITTGSSCEIADLPMATRSGYTFKGWGKDKTCASGASSSLTLNSSSITYYACWEKSKLTYNVSFNGNGGTINGKSSDSCSTTGTSCNITNLPTATRSGYTFTGWGTNSSCTSGSTSSLTLNSSSITYYACWNKKAAPIKTYKATFNGNGGTINGKNSDSCSTVASSCNIAGLPTATREGYIFTGWDTNSSCTAGSTSSLTLNSSKTYYACWDKPELTYNVSFNGNGGTINGNEQMTCTSKEESCNITNLPTATREGYTFTGWGNNNLCTFGNVESLTLNLKNSLYYACWLKNQAESVTYEVEFYDGDKKIHNDECVVNKGEAVCEVKVPEYNPEVEDKTFTGWGNKSSCTTGNKETVKIYENSKYYACYMEEFKPAEIEEESSVGIIILCVVLGLIGVGAIGYGGWLFFKSKSKSTSNNK